MPRVRKPNWLQLAVELDRHLWSDANFRQQHVDMLLLNWVNNIPSKQYPNGSILAIPSDFQRADTSRRSLYQALYQADAALVGSFDLPPLWYHIEESHVSVDDHSVASCATSTYDGEKREADNNGLDGASLQSGLKRKRTQNDGSQPLEEFLFDQARARQLIISPHSVRPSAFFQDTQATLGSIVKISSDETMPKRARTLRAERGDSHGGESPLFAQKAVHNPSPFDLEVRDLALGNQPSPNVWALGSDHELEPPGATQSDADSALSNGMFEDLWPYCPFRLHDPTKFESEACKTRRIAVSHVITHMVKSHSLTRGIPRAASGRSIKYLVHCGVEFTRSLGCTRCSKVADWTFDDLVDNASHVGQAICLRCYEAFDSRNDLWAHLRRSTLCLDKGQILSKSMKAHLLYKTFCSKDDSPNWIPPIQRQPQNSEQHGQATLPMADHALALHPRVPEPGLVVSDTPTLPIQRHANHVDFSSVPDIDWLLISVHNSIGTWAQENIAGLHEPLGYEWTDPSALPLNLNAGESHTITEASDHYAFTEQAHEWQQSGSPVTWTGMVPWESIDENSQPLEDLSELLQASETTLASSD